MGQTFLYYNWFAIFTRRKMLKSLLLISALVTTHVYAQSSLTLVPIGDSWKIDQSTVVGASSRVKTYNQDPYPFCFSVAASLLWDQQRCMADSRDCNDHARTNFISITPRGQQLPMSQINVFGGGSPLLSLQELVNNGGAALHTECNLKQDALSDLDENVARSKRSEIAGALNIVKHNYQQWRKYKDYTPYLERWHAREFIRSARIIDPSLTDQMARSLLEKEQHQNELFASLLLDETCQQPSKKDTRFGLRYVKLTAEIDTKRKFDIINAQLDARTPVMISFCLYSNQKEANCVRKHAMVIIAKAQAVHNITTDRKTVYWVINTWGEEWQRKNNDGWVSVENLIDSVFGEIVWLEHRQQRLASVDGH